MPARTRQSSRTRRRASTHAGAKPLDTRGKKRVTPKLSLMPLVARATSLNELLPELHKRALGIVGGRAALLFERNARSGAMHATSGYGLETMPTEPWIPALHEAALVGAAFSRAAPTLVTDADRQMPELARRLGTRSVVLLPLAYMAERFGLLAIGSDRPPDGSEVAHELIEVSDALVAALELFRLRQRETLQRDLRSLLDEFAAILGSTLNLSSGLDAFCRGANRLFGADRTSVWVHDRRSRELMLRASSDSEHLLKGTRIPADDPSSPAASVMRRPNAEIHPPASETANATITVPLRGCRRALGTIVFEGVRVETGDEFGILERADELGRQLSGAIENIQLLDDVVRSRRELENTFDSISHLVVVWDTRGLIVQANRAFATRVGVAADEVADRSLTELVGPEMGAWLTSHVASDADPAGSVTREIVDPVLGGPFVVTLTALRNREGERAGSVLVARDLAPQAKLQAEREELRQRLVQSEKLAAVGQFVAGIAHELNNPLQGVLGHLELLRVTGAFPKSLRREVQTIYREADRAAKIVRNLLAFSGSRRFARRSVSLNAVLQKVVAMRAASCRAGGIEVVRHYDPKLPRVQSDPLLLHQVFLNIVTNAEHAVVERGTGGRIEISTSASPLGNRIIASVRDNGHGIPPEVLSRVFEPFYTTKEVGKGTGLGLAITYGIVQEHGGAIVAANHPEGGAVFTVELPTTPSDAHTGSERMEVEV